MHHKTINCKPIDFDVKFKEWKQEVETNIVKVTKAIISHDGDNHYILYTLGASKPELKAK